MAAVLLHGVLFGLLQESLSLLPARHSEERPALRLVWVKPETVPAQAPPTRMPPAATPPARRPGVRDAARGPARTPPVAVQPSPDPATPDRTSAALPAAGPLAADAAPAAASAAAVPAGRPAAPWETEATRRAILEAARQVPLGELAAGASGESGPLSPQDRLGRGIESGALGDCLKGEFAGGGGGLLSLPFWMVAELRGKCRR